MKPEQIEAIENSVRLSLAGQISFGQVVQILAAAGVERYHADYTRAESTYYLADGDSRVETLDITPSSVAAAFSGKEVEASIRRAQRGEIAYRTFIEQTSAAGCVGYFVQIAGRQVIYFGRDGQMHIEPFPPAPKQ